MAKLRNRYKRGPLKPPREPPITRIGKALGFRSWKLDGYNLFSANQHFGGWKIDEPTEAVCYGGLAGAMVTMQAAAAQFGYAFQTLGSSTRPAQPSPRVPQARPNPEHDAPHPDCGCGLYALHAPEFMSRWHQDEPLMVHGAVLGWGRMEVHHEGFRAQYAQPVMLAFDGDRQPYNHCERVKAMGAELGLPVVEWAEFEAEARKLAEPVPPELRPAKPRPDALDFGWGSTLIGGGHLSPHTVVSPTYQTQCACGTVTNYWGPPPPGSTCPGCGK